MHFKVIVLQFLLFFFGLCYTINVYNQVDGFNKSIVAKVVDSKSENKAEEGEFGEKEAEKEGEKTTFSLFVNTDDLIQTFAFDKIVLHQLNIHPEWFYNSVPPNGIDVPPDNFS